MREWIKQVLPALIISSIVSGASAVTSQKLQGRLLEDNIIATNRLAETMTDLRVQLSIFGERYVTRDELERRLSQLRSTPHGP